MKHLLPIIGVFLLVSCGSGGSDTKTLTHAVAPEVLTATMALRVTADRGEEKDVAIVVQNPARVPVQSVRSWVQFDPSLVRIHNLAIEEGRLSLSPPGEREINADDGFVQIGVAAREAIRDETFTVASFTVRSIGESDPVLMFYDWREEGDGHSAILSISEGGVHNMLAAPPSVEL